MRRLRVPTRSRRFSRVSAAKWADDAFATGNLINERRTYVEPACNLARRKIVVVKQSDGMGLQISQLRSRREIAPQVHQSAFPLSAGVLRKSNPFKVFRAVVEFVAVQMVNRRILKKAINKGAANKAMHAVFRALAFHHNRDFQVSVPAEAGAKDFSGSGLNKLPLDNAIALAPIYSGLPLDRPNSAQIANFENALRLDTRFPDFALFHYVNIPAGHR